MDRYPANTAELALLPLAMRMARPARGGVARHHPQEPRLHPPDRGPRPRRAGQRLAAASPSTGPTTPRSCWPQHQDELGVGHGRLQDDGLPARRGRATSPSDEVPEGARTLSISGTELRERLAERPGDPGVVHLPGGGRRVAAHPSAAQPAGLHGVLHRPVGLGQVHHRQRPAGQAAGDGRPAGHAARRRPGAQEPVVRAGLLQGAPRHQHPAHRLRRVGDHQERRHRHLRPDRPLRLESAQGRAPA